MAGNVKKANWSRYGFSALLKSIMMLIAEGGVSGSHSFPQLYFYQQAYITSQQQPYDNKLAPLPVGLSLPLTTDG